LLVANQVLRLEMEQKPDEHLPANC
jgi:hypothetical protein